jgi:glycosyltransferase involved in cell wall biosynthesis
VGFVGRVSTEKSPGVFVQVAKKVLETHPFAKFVVVGDGKSTGAVRDLVLVLGVEHAFVFAGALYGDDLVQTVKGLDVVLNTPMR